MIPAIVLGLLTNIGFVTQIRPPMAYYVMSNYQYIYGVEYGEKFCEDYETSNQPKDCQHTPGLYKFFYFYDGLPADEYDENIVPEDCTRESIENGQCRFGILDR